LGIAIMGTVIAAEVSVSALDPRYPLQFVDGWHRALYVGAAILAAGALVAVATIRKPRQVETKAVPEPAPTSSPTFEKAT
ncbi:MAG TPA: hypothetical protein VKB73_08685, partial [Gaiellaceae bacterium]|nr:hypothetical protein [Gaiellaceae bacterium]